MIKKVREEELSFDDYRFAMEKLPLATVDILFFNSEKTKTLLGRRENEPYAGTFYSFGGRLLKNEELADAACRIAKKETGVSLSPSKLTFVGILNEISDNSRFDGINYHAVDIYFGCVIEKQAITLDEQHSEAKWFDVNDPTLHPNVRARIDGALRAL
ncbi:MAG: NUDIX domain-containing protein [bacterium]|nr:NUDIX domain-containing protein [bacterium]